MAFIGIASFNLYYLNEHYCPHFLNRDTKLTAQKHETGILIQVLKSRSLFFITISY